MKSKRIHSRTSGWFIHFSFGIVLAGLLAGCVFKRTTIPLTLAPKVDQPLTAAPKTSLELGEFKDSRLVTDGYVVLQKENAYGTTEGAYVTEQPLAGIVRDGLQRALEQNGFRITNGAAYVLRGELQNSGAVPIQGVILNQAVKFWLTTRFDLVDTTTGLTVWHDTYTGQDTATNLTFNSKNFIVPACSNMAVDVIRQLVSDKMFRRYF